MSFVENHTETGPKFLKKIKEGVNYVEHHTETGPKILKKIKEGVNYVEQHTRPTVIKGNMNSIDGRHGSQLMEEANRDECPGILCFIQQNIAHIQTRISLCW